MFDFDFADLLFFFIVGGCSVDHNFTIGVGDGEQIAIDIVLGVEDGSLVLVEVVEGGLDGEGVIGLLFHNVLLKINVNFLGVGVLGHVRRVCSGCCWESKSIY